MAERTAPHFFKELHPALIHTGRAVTIILMYAVLTIVFLFTLSLAQGLMEQIWADKQVSPFTTWLDLLFDAQKWIISIFFLFETLLVVINELVLAFKTYFSESNEKKSENRD